MGWWAWWDQGWYQRAAAAWAHGETAPGFHWYLPGYSLLGAPFVRLTPADPFLAPNLACLIGTLWLFCGIAARVLRGVPIGARWRVPLACGLFVASTALPEKVLWSWVVPWTTTPETLCIYGALFGAIRLMEGARRRDAFLAGFASVAIAGFRPLDAAVVMLAIGAVAGPALLLRRQVRPALLIAAACGAAVPAVIFGGAYALVWGAEPSGYVTLSQQFGFDLRLLPLRWVTLMIDPRPLYPEGRGLTAVFFWILPGLAGMAAALVAARAAGRVLHLMIVVAVIGDLLLFLIYRDLHPTGLWRFGNYHYFKWMLPLFALYALRFGAMALGDGRSRAAMAAAGMGAILLTCWRADLVQIGTIPNPDGNTISIPGGLTPIDVAVLVQGRGVGLPTIASGEAAITDGPGLRYGSDFVIYDEGSRMRIVPLRVLPAAMTTVRFAEGTVLESEPATLARQAVHWGLPFWMNRQLRGRRAATVR